MKGPDITVTSHRFDGLIFDMDGTLTHPSLDFEAIRREIGITGDIDLTHAVKGMSAERQAEAWAIIESHEERAIADQQLQDGVRELLVACRDAGIKLGILTRNTHESVDRLCEKFDLVVDMIVAREFPFIKPHPGPVLHILEQWQLPPGRVLMVGDYIHDIECGLAAGTQTCFFQNPGKPDFSGGADHAVHAMHELAAIVFPGEGEGVERERWGAK